MEELDKLIEACKAGKRDAQSELYKRYAPNLFGVCMRYCRDTTEAEDTLHEAFLKVFEKIGQYTGKGAFGGWVTRIAINIALEKYRTRYRLQTVDDMTVFDKNDETISALDTLNHQQLLELIKQLPPRYKMVFNMYAVDGYSHKEIAEHMGITEGTSKSNLNRARKILQEKIFELGFIEEEYAKQR